MWRTILWIKCVYVGYEIENNCVPRPFNSSKCFLFGNEVSCVMKHSDRLTNQYSFSQTGGECAEKAVSLREKCWNLTNTAKVNYSTIASDLSCELPSRPELEILRPDAFEDILPQELSKSETFWMQKDDSNYNQSVCERFWSDTFEIEDSTCNREVFKSKSCSG